MIMTLCTLVLLSLTSFKVLGRMLQQEHEAGDSQAGICFEPARGSSRGLSHPQSMAIVAIGSVLDYVVYELDFEGTRCSTSTRQATARQASALSQPVAASVG